MKNAEKTQFFSYAEISSFFIRGDISYKEKQKRNKHGTYIKKE